MNVSVAKTLKRKFLQIILVVKDCLYVTRGDVIEDSCVSLMLCGHILFNINTIPSSVFLIVLLVNCCVLVNY